MKSKVYFSLSIFLFLTVTLNSQDCPIGDIVFNTQEQIDEFNINYPDCTETSGSLIIEEGNIGNITNLNGLSQLTIIEGNLVVKNNTSLTGLSGLENLTKIFGSLTISNNESLFSISSLNALIQIGNDFNVSNNNSLESIEGLSSLSSFPGSFNIHHNPVLTGVYNFTSLDTLGGINFTNNQTFKDFSGFSSVTNLGLLFVFKNPEIENFSGLDNVNKITSGLLISECNSLTSLEGLDNITVIGPVNSDDTNAGGFFISQNPLLYDLTGLNNLTYIWGRVGIYDNEGLTSLDGLENVQGINGHLVISGNSSLSDIYGIRNIDPATIQYSQGFFNTLELRFNPMLSHCALESICGFLELHPWPYGGFIKSNAPGCNTRYEIDCNSKTITGTVFYDQNQNKVQDENEPGMNNIGLYSEPGGSTLFTNQNGKFIQLSDSGIVYTIGLIDHPNFILTTDSISYTIPFEPGAPINFENNFGLYANTPFHNESVSLTSYQPRCNSTTKFFINYENMGNIMESGKIILTYDPSTSPLLFPNQPFGAHNPDIFQIVWDYDAFFPFQNNNFSLLFTMPDETYSGEVLNFNIKITRDSMEIPILMDEFNYSPTLVCSYDPNDKLVMPPGVRDENYTLHDEKLTYTIRFQNTGNAEAIDIRILDTLDTDLDLSTFRVLNSSFPVQTSLNGYNVEFFFNNIWLPDSTSNEPASHGFVTYEISPVEGLEDYTEITNTAHIIFDFNPPIVTNTTLNTMVEMIPTGTEELEESIISIHPNPASSLVTITAETGRIDQVQIFNQLGQEILRTDKTTIDISYLLRGFYVLSVRVDEQVIIGRLIVE